MQDIAKENSYISYMMPRISTQNVEKEVHKLEKGDSLWNLAKNELEKDGKATNQQISDYMLLIAKLNGLDSYEKMNNLKVNEKIYLPDTDVKSAREYIGGIQKSNIPEEVSKSISDIMELMLSDETVKIAKSYKGYSSKTDTYYVNVKKSGSNKYFTYDAAILFYSLNDDGKVTSMSFDNTKKDLKEGVFDYDIDADGKIYERNGFGFRKQIGTISQEEYKALESKIKELMESKSGQISTKILNM